MISFSGEFRAKEIRLIETQRTCHSHEQQRVALCILPESCSTIFIMQMYFMQKKINCLSCHGRVLVFRTETGHAKKNKQSKHAETYPHL